MKKIKDSAFEYAFKIWLTSLLASPLVYALLYFSESRFRTESPILQIFGGWLILVFFSFVPSVASLFLLSFATKKAIKSSFTPIQQRSILAIVGLLLTVLPIFAITGFNFDSVHDEGTLKLMVIYLIFTIGGIYIYQLPVSQPTEK